MRILFVGEFEFENYELSCTRALEKIGHEVVPFAWNSYFDTGTIGKAQLYFLYGPAVSSLNRDLVHVARKVQPDMIVVRQGRPIWPETLRSIKKSGRAILSCITNDNPFSRFASPRLWRYAISNIPLFDYHFVFRHSNVYQFNSAGAKHVHLLRAYFVPELHHPVQLSGQDEAKFSCDAVFVGHYEPDGRSEALMALAEDGFNVKLWGIGWDDEKNCKFKKRFRDIRPVRGEDYAKALIGAKAAICFLSKWNEDTYTSRCFEIPACRTVLVSERTEDLQAIFEEDKEILFFSSKDELREKVRFLVTNPDWQRNIREAGHRRVLQDGHDVMSRMKEMIRVVEVGSRV